MIYVASPYYSPDVAVRWTRYTSVQGYVAKLIGDGYVAFSPVVHNHWLSHRLPDHIRHSHQFWMDYDLPILERADLLMVYQLPGWDVSHGVAAEIAHAKARNIPVHFQEHLRETDPSHPTHSSAQPPAPGVRPREANVPRAKHPYPRPPAAPSGSDTGGR